MGTGRFYARRKSKEINPSVFHFRKGGHLKKKKIERAA
jgi:hypothetical protein